jgi:hypothetical protein
MNLANRLLSKRCLYSLPDQVYFQCQATTSCEGQSISYSEDLHQLNRMIVLMKNTALLVGGVPDKHRHFEFYFLLVPNT